MKRFFKIMLFSVCILLLYACYVFYPIYQAINVSALLINNTKAFEQHPLNPNKYILVAGDSNAVGVGANDPSESIAGRLGHQFPNADITNLGLSGAKLKDLLFVLKKQNKKHYDLIILHIGGNDITHFTPYDTIRVELAEVISLSNKLSPKTILLTAGNIGNAPMFYWPLSAIITDRTLGVREIFIDEAAKNKAVSYIDLFKNREDDELVKNLKKNYSPDMFHLSGAGYEIWYHSIKKEL